MKKFELSFGGSEIKNETIVYDAAFVNNAVIRFALEVTRMNERADMFAAWARLRQLPDALYPEGRDMVAWTKM